MKTQQNSIYEDGTYFSSNPSWHEEDSPWKALQIAKIIEKNSINPETICEIGCGAGEILQCLSKQYNHSKLFHGFEISPQAFEICSRKSTPNIKYFNSDLFECNEVFDIVMAIDVFEHVEDYFGFLRKLKTKAKYKIFHIPLDLSVQTVLRAAPITHARETVGHIHYFTKETALASLRDTGYNVLDFFYTAGSLELPSRSWKSELLRVPRLVAYRLNKDWAVRILGGCSLLVFAE